MLRLDKITKIYNTESSDVIALQDVSLAFRKCEFVSVLGPSGCGKTTLLNIIGGLDRYTSGDLVIEHHSTTTYEDGNWDAYRNNRVGFVFQTYNLISHLNVLQNVELALTLSGVGPAERHERAVKALKEVGLSDQLDKKPNQLSGGQMQRVSCARALVNNPDIILADEPTGALDSITSIQIMELLAEIAKTKLVIMVTHNSSLAEQYSSRIVRILDGKIVGDSKPYAIADEEQEVYESELEGEDITSAANEKSNRFLDLFSRRRRLARKNATSMSFSMAISLSFRNLMTKKVRSSLTAIAGSIGIIGVGLVLAISNGFEAYIDEMTVGQLASFPIVITETTIDQEKAMEMSPFKLISEESELEAYSDSGIVMSTESTAGMGNSIQDAMANMTDLIITNDLTDDYYSYLDDMDASWGKVHYLYDVTTPFAYYDTNGNLSRMSQYTVGWQPLLGDWEFAGRQYDLIAGTVPQSAFEVVLIVDKYNRVGGTVLQALGVDATRTDITVEELLGEKTVYYLENDGYYTLKDGKYSAISDGDYASINSNYLHPITITGIIRIKAGFEYELMTTGLAYTTAFTDYVFEQGADSEIAAAQIAEATTAAANGTDIISVKTGKAYELSALEKMTYTMMGMTTPTNYELYESDLTRIGGLKIPYSVYIFPFDYDTKTQIKAYLDTYNTVQVNAGNETAQVVYSDVAESVTGVVNEVINIVSIVLICFAAISLVVSSVMIGIITYVSVVERTKEIGVLRSIGARKIDIANVFNAETAILGFSAGTIGVAMTYILSIPINYIIKYFAKIPNNLAAMLPANGIMLVCISVALTIIAGFIPAIMAARKDPVVALRTE